MSRGRRRRLGLSVVLTAAVVLLVAGAAAGSGSPTTTILDAFTRADNAGPPSASWSHQPVGSTAAANDLKVVGNRAGVNAVGSSADYWNAQTFGPDSEAYVTIVTKTSTDQDSVSLGLREQNPGTATMSGYQAIYYSRVIVGYDQWQIGKWTNGTFTQLAYLTGTLSPKLNNGDKIWFKAVGASLEFDRFDSATSTWSVVLTATDSTYSGAGYISLAGKDRLSPLDLRLDDFGGGTIGGGTPPANLTVPTISGTAAQGQTLTATQGTWSGSPAPTLTDQWRRCNTAGANCVDIAGATGLSYVVTSADAGSTLRIRETATNPSGSATADSAATAVVPGSGGSGMAPGLSSLQAITENASVGGGTVPRYYKTYRPAGCTGTNPCPLIVELHGSLASNSACYGQTLSAFGNCVLGTSMTSGTGAMATGCSAHCQWGPLADSSNVILAFPVGPAADGTCVSGACTVWQGINSDNTKFFEDLIAQVETSGTVGTNIDAAHVYLIGDSAGALALGQRACNLAPFDEQLDAGPQHQYNTSDSVLVNEIAGIGLWSGWLSGVYTGVPGTDNFVPSPACSPPIGKFSVIDLHGNSTADLWAGTCNSQPFTGHFCDLPVLNAGAFWRSTFGCSTTDTGPADYVGPTGKTVKTHLYVGCSGGKAYELIEVVNGGHDGAMVNDTTPSPAQSIYTFLSTH